LCVGATANFRTGAAVGPVRTAMNTRFDMYENPFFGSDADKDNPQFRPALNVVKGHTEDDLCKSPNKPSDPDVAMGYPRDKCFRDDNCPDGRWGTWGWQDETSFGDGALGEQYWDTNHNESPVDSGITGFGGMTRYEVYRWEIENSMIANNSSGTPTGENAKMKDNAAPSDPPQCYTGDGLTDPSFDTNSSSGDDGDSLYIDRRVFTMAAVNCRQYEADTGKKLAGNESNVPVIGFIDFFLTQPVEKQPGSGGSMADIYGEVIGVSTNGNGLREIVQLYR